MDKIKSLFQKYADVILYLFFGGCTTIINIVTYWAMAHPLGCSTIISNITAWFASVLVAYLTNRKWVFHTSAKGFKVIFSEAVSFFACRVATGVFDVAFMTIFVDFLHFNDMLIKITSNVMVVILNFVASKFIVFKKK